MKRHLLRLLLIALAVAAAFGPSINTPFFMDDYLHLSLLCDQEKSLRDIGFNSYSTARIPDHDLREAIPWWGRMDFRFNYFRPSPTLLLAMDGALWGQDARGYHLTSLILHMILGFVLYGFCVSMGLRPGYALLGSLAACVHFNHLFSVSWMCARDNTLGTILVTSTLWLYTTFLKREGSGKRRAHLAVTAFVTLVLGVFSKENVVLAPALLVVLTFVHGGVFTDGEGRVRIRFRAFLPLVPFLAYSVGYVLWYAAAGHGASTGYILVSLDKGIMENLAIMIRNLYLYLVAVTLFIPPDFPNTQTLLLQGSAPFLALLPAALWVALAVWKRGAFRSLPVLWLFLAWFFLFLFTPLWFIPKAGTLFVSTVGFCLYASGFLQTFVDGFSSARRRRILVTAFALFFVLLPLALNGLGTALLAAQGDKIHLELDRALVKMQEENPGSTTLFLLNAPNPGSVYMAGVVYDFHHPDKGARIYALGNAGDMPEIRDVEEKGFCLYREEGVLVLDAPFPKIPMEEGLETSMPGFRIRQQEVKDRVPREVCFRFDQPLASPEYLFVGFRDGAPVQADLHNEPESGRP